MFVRGVWVKRPSGWLKFDYDYDDDYDYEDDFFVHRDTEFFVEQKITSLRSVTHFLCSLMYVHKTFRCFSVNFVLSRMH